MKINPATAICVGLALAAAVAAAFYFSGREYKLRFAEADIQSKLAENAPFTERYFGIFEVTLSSPRVELLDGSDRISAGADVTLNIHINDNPRPIGGTIDFSGAVDYVPEQGQFFLVEPVIENFDVQGIPAAFEGRARLALSAALARFYATRPIYTLDDGDLRQNAARLLLRDVDVADDVLTVTLGVP